METKKLAGYLIVVIAGLWTINALFPELRDHIIGLIILVISLPILFREIIGAKT